MGRNTCRTMKVIFLLTLASFAAADWTCDECERMFRAIVASDISEDGINEQIDILLAEVCPEMEDPEECVAELPGFWSKLAPILWTYAFNPEAVCASLCGKPENIRDVTCEECKDVDPEQSERCKRGISVLLPAAMKVFQANENPEE